MVPTACTLSDLIAGMDLKANKQKAKDPLNRKVVRGRAIVLT